jgi:Ca-activated chloride channel family protein
MFTANVYHNPYLRLNQTSMQAVLSIKVDESATTTQLPLALAIVLDRSASMDGPKMRAARDGAIKVVQALDESMLFMIVSFNDMARILFGPAQGTAANKQHAINALRTVTAANGTCMSTALNTVVDKFGKEQTSRAVKVLFLTDGKNEGETRKPLNEAIARCSANNISINAWGVGTDWDAAELRSIADATHGSADIIPTPNQIETAFTGAFREMQKTAIANARLHLWTPAGVRITQIEQVFPTIIPLGIEPDPANPRQIVVSIGALAIGDQRDFLLTVETPSNAPGQQFLLMRPSFKYFAGGAQDVEEKSARSAWLFAQWTEDNTLAAQIEEHIAHYTHQEELSQAIKEGQAALASGDREKATRLLGRALEISEHTHNDRITRLLNDIVQRDAKGTIQLNSKADVVARKTLAINVSRTSRLN